VGEDVDLAATGAAPRRAAGEEARGLRRRHHQPGLARSAVLERRAFDERTFERTPSQREHLITTFLEKKQDGLLKELDKQPVMGRFNFPGYMGPDPNNTMRLGTDIRYARNFAGEDGGRRIVIITPRIIGFREEVNNPRTTDYPFSVFEMRFDGAGNGQGKLAYGTKIMFDKKKNNVEIENYGTEPVRLNNLKLEVKK